MPPQRPGGRHVGARRTAKPKVDPAGKQGRKRAKLFGYHQRRVVGQHDTARPDPDGRGRRRHMANDNRSGG